MRAEDNPFTPSFGIVPYTLAGREKEIGIIEKRIARLAPGAERGAQAVMMYGPRGVGKTVMLTSMADKHAATGELQVIEASANTELAEAYMVAPQMFGISPSLYRRAKDGATSKRLETGIPGSIKTAYDLKEPPPPHTVKPLLVEACRKTPKMLLVDEAHNLKPEVAKLLLDYAQSAASRAPFFLILAGTPGLKQTLNKADASFVHRSYSLAVGNLEPEAAWAALKEPCIGTGMSITEDVLEDVVSRSDHYPYFIQMWGEHLWDNAFEASSNKIDKNDVDDVEEEVEDQKEKFYSGVYEDIAGDLALRLGSQIIARALLADQRLTKVSATSLIKKIFPPTVPEEDRQQKSEDLIDRIEDIDFVWRRGKFYEAGIPSFMEYILDMERANEEGME